MKWVPCHKCCDYAFVDEGDLRQETGCCDLRFTECEQSALERLAQGDRGELLRFINWCFRQRREVPAWAQESLDEAVTKVAEFEVKSWDEVFSRPFKKGKQLAAARRKSIQVAAEVWRCANARRRAGESVDSAFFAAIGKELGIGGATVVSEIYYAILEEFRASDEAEGPSFSDGVVRRETKKLIAKFEPPFDPLYDGPPRHWLIFMR